MQLMFNKIITNIRNAKKHFFITCGNNPKKFWSVITNLVHAYHVLYLMARLLFPLTLIKHFIVSVWTGWLQDSDMELESATPRTKTSCADDSSLLHAARMVACCTVDYRFVSLAQLATD